MPLPIVDEPVFLVMLARSLARLGDEKDIGNKRSRTHTKTTNKQSEDGRTAEGGGRATFESDGAFRRRGREPGGDRR